MDLNLNQLALCSTYPCGPPSLRASAVWRPQLTPDAGHGPRERGGIQEHSPRLLLITLTTAILPHRPRIEGGRSTFQWISGQRASCGEQEELTRTRLHAAVEEGAPWNVQRSRTWRRIGWKMRKLFAGDLGGRRLAVYVGGVDWDQHHDDHNAGSGVEGNIAAGRKTIRRMGIGR